MSAKKVSIGRIGGKGKLKAESPTLAPPETGGKPVLFRDVNTVLSLNNREFHEKQLCDGIVLDLGDACAYGCEFCDGESKLRATSAPLLMAYNESAGTVYEFPDVVIRSNNAIELLKRQLFYRDGRKKFNDHLDNRVVFFPVTVDVAANRDLLRETAEACNLILNNTYWQIRLLSRSDLLHRLIADGMIPKEHYDRLIFGISIGTSKDRVGLAIESGVPPVSERLKSLHWLQDKDIRTFCMICPSLPQLSYAKFSRDICEAIRVERCEQVWAKVINYQSASDTKTIDALRLANLNKVADMLEEFTGYEGMDKWEESARATFTAHAKNIPPEKLRFLHHAGDDPDNWWYARIDIGAVAVGTVGKRATYARMPPHSSARVRIVDKESIIDGRYLEELEEIVTRGIKASIAAAKALFEIHSYKEGILWKSDFLSFEEYCRTRWDYSKAHSYRLVDCGGFVKELKIQSESPKGDSKFPKGDSNLWMPVSETHVRPLLALPKEDRVECWLEVVAETSPNLLTGKDVTKAAQQRLVANGVVKKKARATETVEGRKSRAQAALDKLELAVHSLSRADEIKDLLGQVKLMIEKSK